MLADIANGQRTWADVLFLIAAILFFVELVTDHVATLNPRVRLHLAGFGLLCIAFLILF